MSSILFLDDAAARHDGFAAMTAGHLIRHVYTFRDACDALEAERFDVAYLDHDLNAFGPHSVEPGMYGEQELTGADVARFIAQMPAEKRPLSVVVHSWNPDGARRMVAILRDADVPVVYQPFSSEVSR